MTVKDLKEFIFENYCKRINFTKKIEINLLYLLKKGKEK